MRVSLFNPKATGVSGDQFGPLINHSQTHSPLLMVFLAWCVLLAGTGIFFVDEFAAH